MDLKLAAVIATIRYMPDDEAKRYLTAILQSLSSARLEQAMSIAQEVSKARKSVGASR